MGSLCLSTLLPQAFPEATGAQGSLPRAAQEYRQLIFPRTFLSQLGRRLPEPPMVRSCHPQANSQGFSEGPKELKPQFLRAVILPVIRPVMDVHSTMCLSPCASLLPLGITSSKVTAQRLLTGNQLMREPKLRQEQLGNQETKSA